jgi:hypothetical protein
MNTTEEATHRIDRLLDAIDLVREDQREAARALLRDLISEDGNFEDAWLWMSVAVDSLDQSAICLDNVLRVNPSNQYAAGALYRIREQEMETQRKRGRYLFYRDAAFAAMWMLIFALLFTMTFAFMTLPIPPA